MNKLQVHKFNEPVAVIGDIHGNSSLLRKLLEQLGDRPILVTGDVGDRGPDTKGVVDTLIARKAIGVLGNHDLWARDFASGGRFDSFALDPIMGGKTTLESYGILLNGNRTSIIEAQYRKIPIIHRDWMLNLAMLIDLEVQGDKYWLTHAGIPSPTAVDPTKDIMPQIAMLSPDTTLWSGILPHQMKAVDRPVIMGHQVCRKPLDLGHVIAIDTGCGFSNGKLTALLLPEREFIQV